MLIYGVRVSDTLDDVVSNAIELHRMANGTAEEQKFHRNRVKNATHQVAMQINGSWTFAPVKWCGAKDNSIAGYPANKEPVTDQFKPVVIAAGFLPVRRTDPRYDELYRAYVSYCAQHGFFHSTTLDDRTFYVQDDDIILPDEVSDKARFPEGAVKTIKVNAYERNPEARRACIASHGCKCAVCAFDFSEKYGDLGRGYIHVHHLVPIASVGPNYEVVPETDLVPVCPNCHAMLHRKGLRTVEELRRFLK
jgi:5-methylcytosine-specific restriction protein A